MRLASFFQTGMTIVIVVCGELVWAGEQEVPVTEFANATWWDGEQTYAGSRFVRGAQFVDYDSMPDRIVDLGGSFVIAPFAEGHNHNVMESLFERANRDYLSQGVFYVKVPTAYPPAIEPIRHRFERADTIDVTLSMGGLTAPGGFPVRFFVNVLSEPLYGGATYEDFAGQVFHEVTTEEEVIQALDKLTTHGADFIKATLNYSEDYEDPEYQSRNKRDLDPALLPIIVREATKRQLPVTAHVASAKDFRTAVSSGVEEIAHLPGLFWSPRRDAAQHRITAEDAAAAAAKRVAVVTTTLLTVHYGNPEQREIYFDLQRENLRILLDAGVEIRIGSDVYDREGTGKGRYATRDEVTHLVDLGVFSAEEVLSLWIATGRAMFPNRRIGCFEPGCEASFLVFDSDPRSDLESVKKIRFAIKQGIAVHGKITN